MSVLIEALTLVVRKCVLDVSYPGGTDAYLHDMLKLPKPPRFICSADPTFVNISFYDPEHLTPATSLLQEHGVVAVDDNKFYELAIVDQKFGPTLPCEWLEWKKRRDGFTYAWEAGSEPGDMATPLEWTPEQSRQLTRFDIRDEPGRCMKLAAEDGFETWIDFKTGEITSGLKLRTNEPEAPLLAEAPGKPAPRALIAVVKQVLASRGIKWMDLGEDDVAMRFPDDAEGCDVIILTNREACTVCCYCSYSGQAPATNRAAVAELLNLINWKTQSGNFEMDAEDGEIRFRVTIDVEGGDLAPQMMETIFDSCLYTGHRYHKAVMQVAFGARSPSAALAEMRESEENDSQDCY